MRALRTLIAENDNFARKRNFHFPLPSTITSTV
jgi:hypothetical protein